MRLLDVSFKRPEKNLAFDEVLLDRAEQGKGMPTLRFWESPAPFVVLGVSQILRREAIEPNCLKDNIPILRRCSAGGCVLQGPGSLNYSLILPRGAEPGMETVRGSYCNILGRICSAFQRHGIRLHHKGTSDLAISGKKVSGSAQKRRRRFILHHGTLLYHVDFDAIERYIREPNDRPQYRGPRTHRGFLAEITLPPQKIKDIICQAFDITGPSDNLTSYETRLANALAKEKYADPDWTHRR